MQKAVFLIITIVLVSFTTDKPGNKDFRILSAEKQTVFGGVVGSGVVTMYRIQVKALRNFTMQADSAWAEGKRDPLIIDIDSFKSSSSKKVKKGEIVLLHFQIRTETSIGGGDYQLKTPGSDEANPPIHVKNAGLIRYKGGKSKYLILNNIKTVETIYAP